MTDSPWAGWKAKNPGPASKDPLHGVTLEMMLTSLVEEYGWEQLGQRIRIKCFTTDPSMASSLKFLRRTPWARQKVETLYLHSTGRRCGAVEKGGSGIER